MILGTDISRWEDDPSTPQKIDFEKMKAEGARFVIFKATQAKFTDKVFQTSWKDAKGILPRGAYCYLDYSVSGLEQAKYFIEVIKNDIGEIPPTCDFECRVNVPQNANAHLWNWLDYVECHTGKIPMIYSSPSYWKEYGTAHPAWKKYPLWIANYATLTPKIPLPWTDFTFWQYTDKGDGIKYGCEAKQVDLNYFNGDESTFQVFLGNTPPPPTKTIEERVKRLEELAKLNGWEV